MISAVVSFHTNPYTCGVARFNVSLAKTMNVKVVSLLSYLEQPFSEHVVLSLKLEEIDSETLGTLSRRLLVGRTSFSLLLHGTDGSELETALCVRAMHVFAANAEIARRVAKFRTDVTSVFAPGAPVVSSQGPVDCRMLTFGMAHKIRSRGYQSLAALIQEDPRSFRLEISTALHEGGAFDESFFVVREEISSAFEGNVRFLGFLADAEISERLRNTDALVAFFPRGARENNTTVLTAMTHGCPVITNLDTDSPAWMAHGETVFDVNKLRAFPTQASLRRVGNAAAVAVADFNFERLAQLIGNRINLVK
jgi:hypothetical protein